MPSGRVKSISKSKLSFSAFKLSDTLTPNAPIPASSPASAPTKEELLRSKAAPNFASIRYSAFKAVVAPYGMRKQGH